MAFCPPSVSQALPSARRSRHGVPRPAERDLFEMTGLRIEAAGKSLPLAADPDGAIRCRATSWG
jgi:hypothetical protein